MGRHFLVLLLLPPFLTGLAETRGELLQNFERPFVIPYCDFYRVGQTIQTLISWYLAQIQRHSSVQLDRCPTSRDAESHINRLLLCCWYLAHVLPEVSSVIESINQ